MAERPAAVVDRLRGVLGRVAGLAASAEVYETWLAHDAWRLRSEAVPLVVGCDPRCWQAAIARHALAAEEAALRDALAAAFDGGDDSALDVMRLRAWADANDIELPGACLALLDFIARTLPACADPATQRADDATAARRAEREIVLGAALALVSRHPELCRDANGLFDRGLIARSIIDKAALWFEPGQPALSPQAIEEVLAPYID